MARRRSKRGRRRRRSRPALPREPKPSEAEQQLLELARRVGAAPDIGAALTLLAEAHAPDAQIGRASCRERV